MRGARSLLLILGLLTAGAARADPPDVALLEISARSDPDWREQDQRMLSRLRDGLAAAKGIRAVPARQVEALFWEKPAIDVTSLRRKARDHLAQGRQLAARLKPRKAIGELAEALRILRAVFPFLDDLGDLEETHFQLGMTYQSLGKERAAQIARNLELSGTCIGLADCILSL